MKKCEKTKKVEYLIVSVIICMVFVPKAFQHTAMCLAALMWLLYIFYQYLKEKNKVKFKQPEVKPDVEKLLIYQMRLRISEKLKSFFPDADFVTEDRNIYDLAVNRKVLCMCTTGTDEYTHANIVVAIVESKIYLDRNDNEQTYISSAMTQRQKTTDDVYGMRYVETAETAAVGRALADVGFGIQFSDSKENDSTAVDSPFPKFDF